MQSIQVLLLLAAVAFTASSEVGHGYKVQIKHEYYPSHHEENYQAGESYNNHDEHHIEHLGFDEGHHMNEGQHNDEGHHEDHHEEYFSHPEYKFEYGVKDEKTGDHKSHWEHRDGDVVKGEYTFDEADGTHRVVEYSSDKKNGFNAVVKNIGQAKHHH